MSKIKRWLLIFGFVSLLALSLIVVAFNRAAWHSDYSQEPQAKAFQRAMGQPLPTGISNLKIAGRGYLWKQWVWMSFSATDKAIEKLVVRDDMQQFTGAEARKQANTKNSSKPKYDDIDMKAVGWSRVAKIETPEVFLIDHRTESFIWFANVIVDRKNHVVYVHAWGD